MAATKDEVYTLLKDEIKPAMASLTLAVEQAKNKMSVIENTGTGISASELKEKITELKEQIGSGEISAGNASTLGGQSLEKIIEQTKTEIKVELDPASLLDDEAEGSSDKTYSSKKIKELLALNVEIDDSTSRDNATYSSAKIAAEIAKAALDGVDEEKLKELIAQNSNIDEDKVRELISAEVAKAGISEQKVNELIAQANANAVDENKVNELIAQANANAITESKVNELITAAKLEGSEVDQEKIKELITAEVEKTALSEDRINELVEQEIAKTSLSEQKVNELIQAALKTNQPSTPVINPSASGGLEEVVIYA